MSHLAKCTSYELKVGLSNAKLLCGSGKSSGKSSGYGSGKSSGSGSGKSSGYGSGKSSGYGSGKSSGSMDVCSTALKMIRDMMKGIQGKKDKVEICKSYNGNMMSKVTMCKSTELQEGLAQTKKICGGKKVVATTVIETKIVKKKRVLAQQGISKDFTLPKYKAERGNYESAFLKASGADAADSTVNYKQVAAKKNVRRRLAEGTSIARWSLAFDKDDKADAAAAVVSSEKFSAAVAKESGTTVQKAMAKVAIVDVKE